ncbi:MAG: hypothetical protein JST36_09305 [Bacteroidetes bacterium]|nr:hypothetical protein [Bacteroidota bacterium]
MQAEEITQKSEQKILPTNSCKNKEEESDLNFKTMLDKFYKKAYSEIPPDPKETSKIEQ